MPTDDAVRNLRPIRRSELAAGLRALGIPVGTVVLVHASLSSLGWVVGGPETVVRALLDCVGPRGTLAAVASWNDIPFALDRWPQRWSEAYRQEMPGFDPEHSEANPSYGRLPERLRTWPGARKSAHPDQRVVAVGPAAEWLTAEHPLDDSFGAGSPFARLVETRGHVLMLGAPLRSLTLLHHAEALAEVCSKRRWTYALPLAFDGLVEWRTFSDIDVESGPFPYQDAVEGGEDPLAGVAAIASAALASGIGRRGQVAEADCHLFPAAELVRFGKRWLEERFAGASGRSGDASAAVSVSMAAQTPRSALRRNRPGIATPPH